MFLSDTVIVGQAASTAENVKGYSGMINEKEQHRIAGPMGRR